MRKLSQKLDEDATEAVEYDITIQSLWKLEIKPVLFKDGPIIINWKMFQQKEVLHLIWPY